MPSNHIAYVLSNHFSCLNLIQSVLKNFVTFCVFCLGCLCRPEWPRLQSSESRCSRHWSPPPRCSWLLVVVILPESNLTDWWRPVRRTRSLEFLRELRWSSGCRIVRLSETVLRPRTQLRTRSVRTLVLFINSVPGVFVLLSGLSLLTSFQCVTGLLIGHRYGTVELNFGKEQLCSHRE